MSKADKSKEYLRRLRIKGYAAALAGDPMDAARFLGWVRDIKNGKVAACEG